MKMHLLKNSINIPALLLIMTVQIAGCLSFADKVDQEDTPSPDRAYIYGSFIMSNYFRKNIVIALTNEATGSVEMIKLQGYTEHSRPENISVFSIKPGRYSFSGMMACAAVRALFTIEKTDCTGRKPFECEACEKFGGSFTAEKGKAYYLGNYTGNSYGKNGGKEIQWSIDSITYLFDEATTVFLEKYRNFSQEKCLPAFP